MSGDLATPWTCPSCEAEVPADFAVCWSCGTSRDGTRNPAFRRVEEYDLSADTDAVRRIEPAHFTIRAMFIVVAVTAVAMAASSRTSLAGRFEQLVVFGLFLSVTSLVFASIDSIVGRVLGPVAQTIAMVVVMFFALAIAAGIFGSL